MYGSDKGKKLENLRTSSGGSPKPLREIKPMEGAHKPELEAKLNQLAALVVKDGKQLVEDTEDNVHKFKQNLEVTKKNEKFFEDYPEQRKQYHELVAENILANHDEISRKRKRETDSQFSDSRDEGMPEIRHRSLEKTAPSSETMDINHENFTKPQCKTDFLTIKSHIAGLKGCAYDHWSKNGGPDKVARYYERIYRYMDDIVHTNHQGFRYTDSAIPENIKEDKKAIIKCAINFMQSPPDDIGIFGGTKTQLNDYGDALMKMGTGQPYTLPEKTTRAKAK